MEDNIDNKIEFKEKLILFYKNNKLKIYSFFALILVALLVITIFKINIEKKNKLISEKYITAGLFLADGKSIESKKIFEEIIFSKNKFYSILSLNIIIEKNLEKDKNKILEYFDLVEKINKSNENLDLIRFKKALYLIKIGNKEEGNDLLIKLSEDDNSKYKDLIEEITLK